MANALYDKGRNAFLNGDIDWTNDTIKCFLLDVDYVPNLATDDFLDDVAAGARVGSAQTLAGKAAVDGVADSNDTVFTSVTNGTDVTQILLYRDSGVESTSALIALIDSATNLPVTPNGGDITVQWDSGANKIFKL